MEQLKVLDIRSLVWGYPGKVLANEPFSTSLSTPTCVFLLGSNGAGKSTFLRTLGGLQKPVSGSVLVEGELLTNRNKTAAAFVFPHRPVVEFMTIRQLILSGFESLHTPFVSLNLDQEAQFERVVELLGLGAQLDQFMTDVSDGEFQKAMIARGWLQDKPLFILDEPAAFLDYHTKNILFGLMQEIATKEKKWVVVSTHDPELAVKYGELFWIIKDQKCKSIFKSELGEEGLLPHL